MKELEPRPGEGLSECLGVVMEVLGDLPVFWIPDHGHVSGGHHGWDPDRGVFGVRCHIGLFLIRWCPLVSARWALFQYPRVLVLEEHLEVSVVPLDWVRGPGPLYAAGYRIPADAGLVVTGPTKTLLLERGSFRLCPNVGGRASSVGLAECVASCGQCDGLLVVHGHSGEGLPDVLSAEQGVWVRVRALWVDVDEAHLHGSQWVLQVLPGIAIPVVAEPLILAPPVDVVLRVPDVRPPATKAQHGSTHGLDRDLPSENQQVCPANAVAVLLLDRPEESSGLVEVPIVGPAVEGCESLGPRGATAPAVAGPVGARCVPCHSDEEGAIVTVVCRPPVLAVGH